MARTCDALVRGIGRGMNNVALSMDRARFDELMQQVLDSLETTWTRVLAQIEADARSLHAHTDLARVVAAHMHDVDHERLVLAREINGALQSRKPLAGGSRSAALVAAE